jgi:hypothetical protein
VSKLVQVNLYGRMFAGLERDDGTQVIPDKWCPRGFELPWDEPGAPKVMIVDPVAFAEEVKRAGLQKVFQ